MGDGLVLYHRLADPESAAIRSRIVELGGRRVPSLWDGWRLHEGAPAIRRAIGAIIAPEAQDP